ncbi:MAG: 1-deoxy-D-xylulose-5-phosphate reductoisomerase [Gammaproteobacteria bacterium]|nr:1-deoxy-D-xylulose-5-phosphate reductoisomerase [Gammaproteobacteria bacterium]
MKGVAILGSTGSVGVNTLAVIKCHPRLFKLRALAAKSNVAGLRAQCQAWAPRYAVMADPDAAERLQRLLKTDGMDTEVLAGAEGLTQAAASDKVDIVVAAIVGAQGLQPALAAAKAGKRILLANKEALVMSGRIFMETVRRHHAELLPIDSEHNAVFQCLSGNNDKEVRRILLTASGGPFRTWSREALAHAAPAQACAHPKWKMGRKISVDSATMMNKGLEVIEACWLFGTNPDCVEVLVQPQSIIHSLVEYIDGSVLAQLSNPDMRIPIAHALAWPRRIFSGVECLDLLAVGRLDFEAPDTNLFPCLRLAYEAMLAGGTTPAILNAANEIAVKAFLEERLNFTGIAKVIETVLSGLAGREAADLDKILEDDARARELAKEAIARQQDNHG